MRAPHFVTAAIAAFFAVVQLAGAQQVNILDARSDSQLLLDHDITHGAPILYDPGAPDPRPKYATAIGLATWKHDRFASADGPSTGGSLTTVPLRFTGTHLEINARVHAGGEIRIELLDPAGQPIAGYRASDPITGDSLRHAVPFGPKVDLSALVGTPITVRFHLRDAELFAFAFRGQ